MARRTSMPDRGDKWEKQLGSHLGPSQWYLDHDEEYLAHDLEVCGRSAWLPKFLNRIAEHEHAYLNSKDQRAVLDTIRLCLPLFRRSFMMRSITCFPKMRRVSAIFVGR